jgi:hypothetical protein
MLTWQQWSQISKQDGMFKSTADCILMGIESGKRCMDA